VAVLNGRGASFRSPSGAAAWILLVLFAGMEEEDLSRDAKVKQVKCRLRASCG
jgi:hypothetical protein